MIFSEIKNIVYCPVRGKIYPAAADAKSLQLCPTLCDPIDGSPPGSAVHGIFQARVLEWGATAFSNIYTRGYITKSGAKE